MALQIGDAPGVAKRAGMAGAFVGVDYQAALALAPEGVDRETFLRLLMQVEAGLMAGYAKAAATQHGQQE